VAPQIEHRVSPQNKWQSDTSWKWPLGWLGLANPRWRQNVYLSPHCGHEKKLREIEPDADFTQDDLTDAMIRAGEDYLLTFDPERDSVWTVLPALFCAMLRELEGR